MLWENTLKNLSDLCFKKKLNVTNKKKLRLVMKVIFKKNLILLQTEGKKVQLLNVAVIFRTIFKL
jgi:hypothetical protein